MVGYQWEGGWHKDHYQTLRYYKPQYVEEPGTEGEIEPDIILDWRSYLHLKHWMLEHDMDSIVHTDRAEDLKIIHRLLDVIEKRSIS